MPSTWLAKQLDQVSESVHVSFFVACIHQNVIIKLGYLFRYAIFLSDVYCKVYYREIEIHLCDILMN